MKTKKDLKNIIIEVKKRIEENIVVKKEKKVEYLRTVHGLDLAWI